MWAEQLTADFTRNMGPRVISDPAALGWVYDPSVDRWRWGSEEDSEGGGGNSADLSELERRVTELETSIDGGSA
jgi:hypothetical protein